MIKGTGPRGGKWHITSGGNKSYYQCKTSNCRQYEPFPTWIIILIIAVLVVVFLIVVISNIKSDEKENTIKEIFINDDDFKKFIRENKIRAQHDGKVWRYKDYESGNFILKSTYIKRYRKKILKWLEIVNQEKDKS